ncbi:MAG: CBS domain-containing protein [Bdellovibrionota bacterium]
MPKLTNAMTKNLVTISWDRSMESAQRLMEAEKIRHLAVTASSPPTTSSAYSAKKFAERELSATLGPSLVSSSMSCGPRGSKKPLA